MQWRFLDSTAGHGGPGSDPALSGGTGELNMAIDEAILAGVEAGQSPPTVRMYGWHPPCISLGHFQKPEAELDLERVGSAGFDVVRRATGGRAVLHIEELTYSVIAPADAETWCATQALSYRAISQAVAQALAQSGFGVALDRGNPVEKARDLRAMTPCFSSTARSEVVWEDRKVVGSAQRRTRSAFLQHGSILVSRRHREIVDCLKLDGERRKKYLAILDRNAVSLDQILDGEITWRRLAAGFLPRLAAALDLPYQPGQLTPEERSCLP